MTMKVKRQVRQEPAFEEIEVALPSYGQTQIDGDRYCHDYFWKVEDLGEGKIRRICIMLRQSGEVEIEESQATPLRPAYPRDVDYFFGLGEYASNAILYAHAFDKLMEAVKRASP